MMENETKVPIPLQNSGISVKVDGHYVENLSSESNGIHTWEYHLDILNESSETLTLLSLQLRFTDEFGTVRDLSELIELNEESPMEMLPHSEYKRIGVIILQSKFSVVNGDINLYSINTGKMLPSIPFDLVLSDPFLNLVKA